MIELVRNLWMGRAHYAFEHGDGSPRKQREYEPKGSTRVAITEAQAALGIDICAALFESGRL